MKHQFQLIPSKPSPGLPAPPPAYYCELCGYYRGHEPKICTGAVMLAKLAEVKKLIPVQKKTHRRVKV